VLAVTKQLGTGPGRAGQGACLQCSSCSAGERQLLGARRPVSVYLTRQQRGSGLEEARRGRPASLFVVYTSPFHAVERLLLAGPPRGTEPYGGRAVGLCGVHAVSCVCANTSP